MSIFHSDIIQLLIIHTCSCSVLFLTISTGATQEHTEVLFLFTVCCSCCSKSASHCIGCPLRAQSYGSASPALIRSGVLSTQDIPGKHSLQEDVALWGAIAFSCLGDRFCLLNFIGCIPELWAYKGKFCSRVNQNVTSKSIYGTCNIAFFVHTPWASQSLGWTSIDFWVGFRPIDFTFGSLPATLSVVDIHNEVDLLDHISNTVILLCHFYFESAQCIKP